MSATAISDSEEDFSDLTITPFERIEYIPFVSMITALARTVLGSLQMVLGTLILPIQLAAKFGGRKGNLLFTDGFLNIFRASVSCIPFMGNAMLYYYDKNRIQAFKEEHRRHG